MYDVSMRTKVFFLLVVSIGVAIALGLWVSKEKDKEPEDNVTYQTVGSGVQLGGGVLNADISTDAVITRTDDGYEPQDVTIRVGDTVMFKNESNSFHWPASNVHPTHTIYSDFDPREPVAPGDTWSFTFTQSGTWGYHDHLRANLIGKIFVEE